MAESKDYPKLTWGQMKAWAAENGIGDDVVLEFREAGVGQSMETSSSLSLGERRGPDGRRRLQIKRVWL